MDFVTRTLQAFPFLCFSLRVCVGLQGATIGVHPRGGTAKRRTSPRVDDMGSRGDAGLGKPLAGQTVTAVRVEGNKELEFAS